MSLLLASSVAYLLGSLPLGYFLGWLAGVDVRRHGSGNIGATNVRRVLGSKAAFATLVWDTCKGVVAVTLVPAWTGSPDSAIAGLCAILGHCFSPLLGFRGGKGVATSLGVFGALLPLQSAVAVAVFVVVVALWKYVSLGSIMAAWSLVIASMISFLAGGQTLQVVIVVVVASLLLTLRHRGNIARMIEGREAKIQIGSRSRSAAEAPPPTKARP